MLPGKQRNMPQKTHAGLFSCINQGNQEYAISLKKLPDDKSRFCGCAMMCERTQARAKEHFTVGMAVTVQTTRVTLLKRSCMDI